MQSTDDWRCHARNSGKVEPLAPITIPRSHFGPWDREFVEAQIERYWSIVVHEDPLNQIRAGSYVMIHDAAYRVTGADSAGHGHVRLTFAGDCETIDAFRPEPPASDV